MSGAFIDHQVAHCALPLFVVPYQDYLWTHTGSSYRSGSRFSMKGFTIAITANLAAGVTQESLQYFDGRRFRTHFDWLAALVPKGWKPSSSTLTQEDVSDTDIRASFENASPKLDSESGAALLASCLRKDRHLAFLEVSRALLQNLAQHLLVLGQLPHIVRDHVEHLLVLMLWWSQLSYTFRMFLKALAQHLLVPEQLPHITLRTTFHYSGICSRLLLNNCCAAPFTRASARACCSKP